MKQFTQNRFLVLLVAILLIANLGLMLYFFAFRHKEETGRMQPRVSDFVQKQLGFNADQSAKFQALWDQHKDEIKPVLEDMKKSKDSLYNLLRNPQATDSAAVALTNRIGEKQKEWELLIFHHFQKVRAICDSSQLPKFDSLVHQMVNRGPWMRKRRPPEKEN
jgi:HSP90 family molecular chaperone